MFGSWTRSIPLLIALAAGAALFLTWRSDVKKMADRTTARINTLVKPTRYENIWVDKPQTTLLTDQSQGAGLALPTAQTLPQVAAELRRMDHDRVMTSPGVHLNARHVARFEGADA